MKRPLFWIGATTLISMTVFLRFSAVLAVIILGMVTGVATILSGKATFKNLSIMFFAYILGLCYAFGFVAANNKELSPITQREQQYNIVLTVEEATAQGASAYLEGIATITAQDGESYTKNIALKGYFEFSPQVGETISCVGDFDDIYRGVAVFKMKELTAFEESSPHKFRAMFLNIQGAVAKRAAMLSKNNQVQGVLKAILAGDKTSIDKAVEKDFSKAGISHLLVVSGLHLVLITTMFSKAVKGFLSGWVSSVAIILFCWLVALISGMGVSVIRAAIMLSIIQLGALLGRRGDTLTSLIVAGLLMAFINPYMLLGVSFWLSFSAVAAIAVLAKPIEKMLPKLFSGSIRDIISVSLAAQVGVAVVLLFSFGSLPILGILANIPACLLITPLMVSGIIGVLISFVAPVLSVVLGIIPAGLAAVIIFVARAVGQLPFAQFFVTQQWQIAYIIGAVALIWWLIASFYRNITELKIYLKFSVIALAAVGVTAALTYQLLCYNTVEIFLFEYGDSILMRKGNRGALVYPPENSYLAENITETLERYGVEYLDMVILAQGEVPTYFLGEILKSYPNAKLIGENNRVNYTFVKGLGGELFAMPQSFCLYDSLLCQFDGQAIKIVFSTGELLKNGDKCDIIGRYEKSYSFDKNVVRLRIR